MISPYLKWLIYFFWLPSFLLALAIGKKTLKRYWRVYALATIGSAIIGFCLSLATAIWVKRMDRSHSLRQKNKIGDTR
jgi:membrane-bound acyltransferase YfiQ involved in biofilm formation